MPSDMEVAEQVVRTGAAVALAQFRAPLRIRRKRSPADLVTDADAGAQATMAQLLGRLRPGDGILAEEDGLATVGERQWLLDPIDGTLAYARGIPQWTCVVALRDTNGTVLSAVCDPVGGELYLAHRDGPATCDGVVLAPAATVAVETALVHVWCDAELAREPAFEPAFKRLLRGTAALRAGGSGSQALAWVAAGRLDAYIELHPFGDVPWDWLPGALLVRAAGGHTHELGAWRIAAACDALGDQLATLIAGAPTTAAVQAVPR